MGPAIGPMPERRDAAPASPRLGERAILRFGIALTGAFLLASAVTGLIPLGGLHGWVATHLALAGAATVAIGTFMPHFGVTLAGTRPEPGWLRLTGVLSLAAGMAGVALGRPLLGPAAAGAAGLVVIVGIAVPAPGGWAGRHGAEGAAAPGPGGGWPRARAGLERRAADPVIRTGHGQLVVDRAGHAVVRARRARFAGAAGARADDEPRRSRRCP
jgi:hypothetical protein